MRRYKISYIIAGLIIFSVFSMLSYSTVYKSKEEPVRSVLAEDIQNLSVIVSDDSYVSSTNKSTNYGSNSILKVKDLNTSDPFDSSDENNVTYLHFDLRNNAASNGKKYDFSCGTCRIYLKFETQNTDLDSGSSFGYYNKGIRIMPYDNWSEDSISYNTMREINPNTGQQANLLLKQFQYPVVEQFVVVDNSTSSALKAEYNAIVTPTGTSRDSIVQVDITDHIKDLMGYEFTIALESYRDFRSEPLEIFSKEATGK
ncbi:hypothetical protein KC678_05820, partial [Candidatus Dojkabacteria bacterium]|nr:hypothetical protein [Candidatus Dojkabacteria bacterium]